MQPLLHKLKAYGFESKLLTFLKNFLSERSFSVKVSSALCFFIYNLLRRTSKALFSGPFLFLIYVNRSSGDSFGSYVDVCGSTSRFGVPVPRDFRRRSMLRSGGLLTRASLSMTTNAPTCLSVPLREASISLVVNSLQRLPNRRSLGSRSPRIYPCLITTKRPVKPPFAF